MNTEKDCERHEKTERVSKQERMDPRRETICPYSCRDCLQLDTLSTTRDTVTHVRKHVESVEDTIKAIFVCRITSLHFYKQNSQNTDIQQRHSVRRCSTSRLDRPVGGFPMDVPKCSSQDIVSTQNMACEPPSGVSFKFTAARGTDMCRTIK